MDTKICSRCRESKEHSEFVKSPSNLDGLSSYCRKCKSEYAKDYRTKVGDRLRAQGKEYYHTHKDELRDKRNKTAHDWYWANKERALQKRKAWRLAHMVSVVYRLIAPNGATYYGSTVNLHERQQTHIRHLRAHEEPNPTLNELSYIYAPEEFTFEIVRLCAPEDLCYYEQIQLDTMPNCNVRRAMAKKKFKNFTPTS